MRAILICLLAAASVASFAEGTTGQLEGLRAPCDRQKDNQRFALESARAEYTPTACRKQVEKSLESCLNSGRAEGDQAQAEAFAAIDALPDPCQAADATGDGSGQLGAMKTQCQNVQNAKKIALKRSVICEGERKKVAKVCLRKDTDAGGLTDRALADGSQCDLNQGKLADAQTSDLINMMNSAKAGYVGSNQDVTIGEVKLPEEALTETTTTMEPKEGSLVQQTMWVTGKISTEVPVANFLTSHAGFAGAAVAGAQGDFPDAASSTMMSTGPLIGGTGGFALTAGGGALAVGCTLLCPSPQPGPKECTNQIGIQSAIMNCNESAIAAVTSP
jgi:hypothetical protein